MQIESLMKMAWPAAKTGKSELGVRAAGRETVVELAGNTVEEVAEVVPCKRAPVIAMLIHFEESVGTIGLVKAATGCLNVAQYSVERR